jgi:hypothetical protein
MQDRTVSDQDCSGVIERCFPYDGPHQRFGS